MYKLGNWLLKERRNAAMLALLFSLLPMLGLPTSWMASVIIALVSLQKGSKDGLFIVFWASLPAVIVWYMGGALALIILLVSQYLLVSFLGNLWRQHRSISLMLEVMTGIGLVSLLVISLYWEGLADFWLNVVTRASEASVADLSEFWKDFMIKASSGIMMTVLLISNIINLLLARAWQSMLFKPGAFAREFYSIRAGKIIAVAFLVCLAGAILDIDLAYGCAFITSIPLIFAGLALVHGVTARQKYKVAVLIMLYGSLILFSIYLLPMLAVVGFVDTWYDVRKRHIRI